MVWCPSYLLGRNRCDQVVASGLDAGLMSMLRLSPFRPCLFFKVVPKVPRGLSGEGRTQRGVHEKKGHKKVQEVRASQGAEESTQKRKASRAFQSKITPNTAPESHVYRWRAQCTWIARLVVHL
jgi:hypothetical protein